jgi:hypothetical protein
MERAAGETTSLSRKHQNLRQLFIGFVGDYIDDVELLTHGQSFTTGKPAPDISGGPWLNSKPLTISDLKGRVVVVEFWTYG